MEDTFSQNHWRVWERFRKYWCVNPPSKARLNDTGCSLSLKTLQSAWGVKCVDKKRTTLLKEEKLPYTNVKD